MIMESVAHARCWPLHGAMSDGFFVKNICIVWSKVFQFDNSQSRLMSWALGVMRHLINRLPILWFQQKG